MEESSLSDVENKHRPSEKKEADWSKPWKNPLVIFWFAILTIVLIVNFFMVSMAIVTAPGLTIEDFYAKGKNMNEILERRKRMEELGWQFEIDMADLQVGKDHVITVRVLDKESRPFNVDSAIFYYYRPSNKDYDGQLDLKPTGQTGTYQSKINLPLKGKYDVVMEVVKGEEVFNFGRSIMVQEPKP